MALSRGGSAAEKEAAKLKPVFGKADFLTMKDGETVILRLIDPADRWIYVRQHNYVPTRPAPADLSAEKKKDYPARMGAVCRKDKSFIDPETKQSKYADCYICDFMRKEGDKPYRPTVRLWARFVVREAVLGTQEMVDQGLISAERIGKVVAYQDLMVTEKETDKDGKETGKTITRPKIVVANMAMDNFFAYFQGYDEAYADDGGILNRDFKVKRKGEGTDTDYSVAALAPTPDFDLASPELAVQYEVYASQAHLSESQLEEMVEHRASDTYYHTWFDERHPVPERKKKDGEKGDGDSAPKGAPVEQQAKPADPSANQVALGSMRERILKSQQAPPPGEAKEAVPAGAE